MDNFGPLTARIIEQCPNLCWITQGHSETDDFDAFDMDRDETVSAAEVKLLPENTLVHFNFQQFDSFNINGLAPVLQRLARSLARIEFTDSEFVGR